MTDTIAISHLSNTHHFVRIENAHRYLLLPVEESADNARIKLIVNNETTQTIIVRLAVNKIDYFVPFDLKSLNSKQTLLDITFMNERARQGGAKDYICWKEMSCSDTFDSANIEMYRPLIHHTPLYGWMNDPNGMFFSNSEYHLYYQYNPYGSQWENMTWGHSVSSDLIHWKHLDNAIRPDALGAIFSGSCVVDKNNTAGFGKDAIIAIYTTAGDDQTQSLAYSTDGGRSFVKYAGNPIITSNVRDFRDPKVFWNNDINRWNLILAAGQEMRIYSSADLHEWVYESSFGKEYGAHSGVWECPDLMKLPVEGKNYQKWALVCNINPGGPFGGSATQYFIGSFDGHKFTCESEPSASKWIDYGKDHYAAVTFSNAPDNRHIMLAWMSNWQYAGNVPTMQYRSSNSIPRDISLFELNGETYIKVAPSKELAALRNRKLFESSRIKVSQKYTIGKIAPNEGCYEIVADFIASAKGTVQFVLSNAKGEKVSMIYNLAEATFSMDRNQSGKTSFNSDFPAITTTPTSVQKKMQLRVFVDKMSIEAFDGNGRFAMTNLVFPSEPYNQISFSANGKNSIKSLVVYNLK